jgi:hypothetical protein
VRTTAREPLRPYGIYGRNGDGSCWAAWVILAGTSLEELVAEAGRALSDARKLFGATPLDGGLPLAQELVTARQGVADAAGSAAASWEGAGAASYRSANSEQLRALDRTIVGDGQLASALTSTGQTAAAGARSMDNLIAETRSGVAAIAPTTGSTAGQQELATYMQGQLGKAKGLVQTYQQRSSELAETIRSASASYGSLAGHSKDARAVPLDSDTWKPGDKRHTPYNAGRGGMGPPNYPDAPPWVDIWDRSGGIPTKCRITSSDPTKFPTINPATHREGSARRMS